MDDPIDLKRREALLVATGVAGGVAIAGASVPFVASLRPSRRALAEGAPIEVDATALAPGELATVSWRGKPVWFLRRTQVMLASLESDRDLLTDPDSAVLSQQPEFARNAARARNPALFVCVGLCTHLGCVPSYRPEAGSLQADWPGGFYCPCHGSKFDLAGRVFRGSPAPTNLVIPPYEYLADGRVQVGKDEV